MNIAVCHMLYVFVLFFKMVQRVEEHRAAVIALHHVGKKSDEISRMFVYQTLARYRESSSTKDQPRSGHPRDIRTQKQIYAVRECIRRNLLCKQKVMSRDMKFSPRTMSRIFKDDLQLGASDVDF